MDKKLFFTTQCPVSILRLIFNSCIKISHKGVFLPFFCNMSINFVSQLFDRNGQMQLHEKIKREYDITESKSFF